MAVNKRDLSTLEGEIGWPVVNYAQEERNFHTTFNGRQGPLSIPRFKFTYLVEFKINSRIAENPVTNLDRFLTDGKLFTQLKRIDHPKPEIKYETLRSYNKWIKVPTVVEFQGASMTFDDDSTSVVQSLWKEYLNFYSHLASVGENIGAGILSNLSSSNAINEYQFTDKLTGQEMRAGMSRRHSLGMKLKANDMRHFFESIVIYDLGTEPDAINVYWFHRPVITVWDHENLDKEDRTGKVEVTANFEYESYYWTFGQNRGRLRDYIQQILGFFPRNAEATRRKEGIGRQSIAQNRSRAVSTTESIANIFASNPTLTDLVSGIPDVINQTRALNDDLMFPTETESAEQAFENSGVEVPPLGEGGTPTASEPVLISQTQPTVPSTIAGKEAELRRIDSGITLAQAGPTTPESLEKIERLRSKRTTLVDALQQQREARRTGDISNTATQSALTNTKSTTGGTPESSTPVVPNPQAQQVIATAQNAVDRTQNEINGIDSELSRLKDERAKAVAVGNRGTELAIQTEISQRESRRAELERRLKSSQEKLDKLQ